MSPPTFDARRFFDLAHTLSAPGREEASLRTAISRAYYACFHLARQGLERSGRWSAGNVNVHERVLSELRARRRHGIHDSLRALRRLREQADYALDVPVDEQTTEEALKKAEWLMRLLDTF